MERRNKDLAAIGLDILHSARNELYLSLPYMDAALCALAFVPGDEITTMLATDGEMLYYSGAFLAERFLRGRTRVNRIYLHVILHCLLRHFGKKRGKIPELWDLACDVAVEDILDSLNYSCLSEIQPPAKQKFYGGCRRDMKVLTAEGVYRRLLRLDLSEYERASLSRLFLADDHGLWDMAENDGAQKRQEQKWEQLSQRIQTGMETALAGQSTGGEAVLERVRVANRDDVDYRAFLRRFAVPREIMGMDGDSFDYGYYAYGLRLYGNLPLVEPPETREEKRIEDFVIAIDTSMSTKGELVRQFLACTYAVLRSTETFTRKVNIHILQCDDQLRSDTAIHDLAELQTYMENFELVGGSATDFRPVFDHVERLQREGTFSSLRGLLYFTDGIGVYPRRCPKWETAFIFLEEPPVSVSVPSWAIRLTLGLSDLEQAVRATGVDSYLDELPEL